MTIDNQANNIIFNAVDNGIIILDKDLSIIGWNHWLEIFTGKAEKEVLKKDFDCEYEYNYESIIVISTNLQFENQNINAELVFMKHKESFEYLTKQLNEFLDDY